MRHGYHGTEQISVRVEDLGRVAGLLKSLRENPPSEIAGKRVLGVDDLMSPADDLPPTDGLRLWLEGDVRVIIRPSGTEAKVKCYVEVVTHQGAQAAQKVLDQLRAPLTQFLLQS